MKDILHSPSSIRTVTGLQLDILNPQPEMICVEDIAHSLSHQCRFGGHLRRFYSVAQHSYAVSKSKLVPVEYKLAALMHDAAEAYMLDMPRPIKSQLTNYKALENLLMAVIAEKFGFEHPMPPCVKKADDAQLEFEWEHLVMKVDSNEISPMYPEVAKRFFIQQFHNLTAITNK